MSRSAPFAACALAFLLSLPVCAQQSDPKAPVVVQPGAPGQPTRTLPSSTRPTLPTSSPADVQFMQGMIIHHAQAFEMTALIETRTENKELRSLGARISRSQADEIDFMKRLTSTKFLTQNEIDAEKTVRVDELNVQNQEKFEWPRKLVVAKAYIDQLERSQALPADRIAALRKRFKAPRVRIWIEDRSRNGRGSRCRWRRALLR